MEIKGIIFDMDGILIDSERYVRDCFRVAQKELGLPVNDECYTRLIGVNRTTGIQIMLDYYKDQNTVDYINDRVEQLYRQGRANKQVPLKYYAKELVDWLKEKDVPICLATSTDSSLLPSIFASNAFETNPFKYYMTGDQVTKCKPDPEIFLKACQLMGLAPENCMVVEDSYNGIRAGYSAGCITAMVPDILQPDEEISQKSSFVFENLEQVKNYLEEVL